MLPTLLLLWIGCPGSGPGHTSRGGDCVPQFPHLYNEDSDRSYRVGVDATSGHPQRWARLFPHAPFLLGILPVVCPHLTKTR